MKKHFRTYVFSLTANQDFDADIPGDFYSVIEAAGEFTITLDDSARIGKQVQGMGGEFVQPFSRVKLLSETTQTVILVLGYGKFNDARATLTATINATFQPGNTLAGVADVALTAATATAILAADATRLTAMIKNPSSNTASVRIGTTGSTGAAQGFELEPGESISIATTAAIVGYSVPGESVSVSVVRNV